MQHEHNAWCGPLHVFPLSPNNQFPLTLLGATRKSLFFNQLMPASPHKGRQWGVLRDAARIPPFALGVYVEVKSGIGRGST